MKLTDEQQIIYDKCDNNIYVSASPGSGKSTMLAQICSKLLKNPNNFVMLVSFTNKAAKSIIDKCESSDQGRILGGTFHGISYRLMRQSGIEKYICDESKKRLIVKKTFNCKNDKEKFEQLYDDICKMKSEYPLDINNKILSQYQDELNKYNLMDFDDIIFEGIERNYGLPKITHILVDELQDTSAPQLELLKSWQKKTNATMIGVADDDQCHPSGNRILTTDGYVDIKDLDESKHKLASYDGHGKMYGLTKGNGYNFQKVSRLYTGKLYTFSNWLTDVSCTYNHKCYVRWNYDKTDNIYITYLMQKNNKFRIGQCKLFCNRGFHLGARSRAERADKSWILGIHNNRLDAMKQEVLLSLEYQIPTLTFRETTSSIHFKQKELDNMFNLLSNIVTLKNITKLLDEFNRSLDFPIWTAKDYAKQSKNTFFITQACNIIPELMFCGFHVHKLDRKLKLEEIKTLKIKSVEKLEVFSLNVEKFHNYICNNMLVSNSIYAWRGARPENVNDFIDVFKCEILNMGYNFRSHVAIVESSKSLITNNKKRITKLIRAFKKEEGKVSKFKCLDPHSEIDYVVSKCKEHRSRKIAILYRNRALKNHLEFEIKKAGLQYTVNDSLEITDRSAVKVMLSVLKICAREFDVYDLQNAAKAIKKFGSTTVSKIEEEIKLGEQCTRVFYFHSINPKQRARIKSLLDLQDFFDKNEEKSLELLVREIEKYFNKSFDYNDNMRSFLIDISKDYKISAGAIKRLNNELGLNGKEEHTDENAKIELSTVHGFKGGECDVVILPWCQQYNEQPGKEYDLEAERRLFYVAITRAISKLYMCYSGDEPRFIKEMKF